MPRVFSLYLDVVRLLAAMLVMLYHANWIYTPGYLVTSLRLEEATMGQPYMATTAPDFAELDTSLLNPREKRVVMVMSASSAFS